MTFYGLIMPLKDDHFTSAVFGMKCVQNLRIKNLSENFLSEMEMHKIDSWMTVMTDADGLRVAEATVSDGRNQSYATFILACFSKKNNSCLLCSCKCSSRSIGSSRIFYRSQKLPDSIESYCFNISRAIWT
jgi:hypothetical protein